MYRFVAVVALCAMAATGCASKNTQDIQTALDAVHAARDAAMADLPDTAMAHGAIGILDVALSTYDQVHVEDDGRQSMPYYLQWLALAARAVSAVVSILDGAGVDIPDVILDANRTLQRWLH